VPFILNYNDNNNINNINILQWNVKSLSVRLPSLQYLLSNFKCSIALLSKTWLLPSKHLNIPHFKIYRSDRHDGYGGAAIVIHNSLKSKLIPIDPATKNSFILSKIALLVLR